MKDPTLILHNANVITMEADRPRASALAVSGDRIVGVGTGEEIRGLAGPRARVIDADGLTVLPGFIDTHVHFVSTGLRLHNMLDLTSARTLAGLLDMIREAAVGREPGSWILGWGFDHTSLEEKRYPDIEELDRAAPEHPVYLRRRDGHSSLLNSAGIDEVGVPPDTPGFNTGADGTPTGVLQARANSMAGAVLQEMLKDPSVGAEACRTAAREAVEVGITTVHALSASTPTGSDAAAMDLVEDELPVRIVKYFQTTDIDSVLAAGLPRIGGCILIDGSVGSQTAALREPYADNPDTSGVLYHEQEEINEFTARAHREGLQIAVHAIGDRAIDQALDAYEYALSRAGGDRDHRHRIEHFLIPTCRQMARARDLGLTLAMQPAFEHFWGGPDGLYASRLGERITRTNPFRALLDMGVTVGGGSDSLVTPMNPLLGIHSAVNHPNPEHRITVPEAVRMFTLDAARLAFEETLKGSLATGKLADLVVLADDPTAVPVDEIAEVQVVATLTGGRFVLGEDRF